MKEIQNLIFNFENVALTRDWSNNNDDQSLYDYAISSTGVAFSAPENQGQ